MSNKKLAVSVSKATKNKAEAGAKMQAEADAKRGIFYRARMALLKRFSNLKTKIEEAAVTLWHSDLMKIVVIGEIVAFAVNVRQSLIKIVNDDYCQITASGNIGRMLRECLNRFDAKSITKNSRIVRRQKSWREDEKPGLKKAYIESGHDRNFQAALEVTNDDVLVHINVKEMHGRAVLKMAFLDVFNELYKSYKRNPKAIEKDVDLDPEMEPQIPPSFKEMLDKIFKAEDGMAEKNPVEQPKLTPAPSPEPEDESTKEEQNQDDDTVTEKAAESFKDSPPSIDKNGAVSKVFITKLISDNNVRMLINPAFVRVRASYYSFDIPILFIRGIGKMLMDNGVVAMKENPAVTKSRAGTTAEYLSTKDNGIQLRSYSDMARIQVGRTTEDTGKVVLRFFNASELLKIIQSL